MSDKKLRLRALGGLRVEVAGRRLTGAAAQRKSLALLALLAVSREAGVSRESLGAYLWPEAEAAKVSHRLNQLLYALRKELDGEDLFLGSVDLRLNPELMTSDVGDFLDAWTRGALEEAASLYAGPFLDGFHLDGAAEFERWVDGRRAELSRTYAKTLETLAGQARAGGQPSAAAQWARRLFEADPLDPDCAIRLMEAFHAAGDRASSLQVADEHALAVKRELGIVPDRRVLSLADQIRNGSSAASAPPAPGDRAASFPSSHTRKLLASGPDLFLPLTSADPTPGQPWRARVPAAPGNRSRRRANLLAPLGAATLLGLLAIAVVGGPSRTPTPDPKRVLVATFENRTGDTTLDALGRIASDWIGRGLSETGMVEVLDPSVSAALEVTPGSPRDLPARARALAARSRAGTLVIGSYYLQGDSLYFEATAVDVAGNTVVAAVPPAAAPNSRPLTAVDALRRRVMVALAFRLDPRLRDLPPISEPPTYEGYRHYVEGLSLHDAGDFVGAIREMGLAAAGDTMFRAPLIVAAADHFWLGEYGTADSLVRQLGRAREHLMPVEDYILQWLEAKLAGDEMKALELSRAWGRLAPGTGLQVTEAVDALGVNRPREALAVLAGIDPDRGVLRDPGVFYWWGLTTAYHVLGQHEREVATAEQARARHHNWDTIFLQLRALAALGRTAELNQVLDESAGVPSGHLWDRELALILVGQDARAHGDSVEGHALFERAVAWCRAHPARDGEWHLAVALYLAQDWPEARRVAERLSASDTTAWYSSALLGRIAAHRGDSATAQRVLSALAAVHRPYEFGSVTMARAEIAALLGRREEAVRLLRQSLVEGFPFPWEIHTDADFESLRGYHPYDDLLRPRG